MNETQDCFTVRDFAKRNSLSVSFLYYLWRQGEGPRCIVVGDRRLITVEAAREWRAGLDQAAAARAVAK